MTDMEDEYKVVAEILEYFDSYNLAAWAPIAAIIRRERNAKNEEIAKLQERINHLSWSNDPRHGGI